MKTYEYQRNYEMEGKNWWFIGMKDAYLSLIGTYLSKKPGKIKILDAGCGTGLMLGELKILGDISGVDFAPEAVEFCRMRGFNDVTQGDASKTPFKDDSFDMVTAFMLIEHVQDDTALLKELKRICRPGGIIILATSAFMVLWSEHDEASNHFRRYTARELKDKVRAAGLSVKKMTYFNMILFLPFLALNHIKKLKKSSPNSPRRTLFNLPGPLSWLAVAIIHFESFLIRWFDLPFGVDILCVLEKK